MTEQEFEEENKKIRKRIDSIDEEISSLLELKNTYSFNYNFQEQTMLEVAKQNADYKLLVLKETKKVLQEKLEQSFKKRKIDNKVSKILSYVPELPEAPKKVYQGGLVTKSMYSISDGCLWWMIGFVVIGLIIIFISTA